MTGFVVGFTAVWQLALVTLAVVPLIALIGGIHTATLSKLSAKSQEALSEAGNIAEQVNNLVSSLSTYAIVSYFELETNETADHRPNSNCVHLRRRIPSTASLLGGIESGAKDRVQDRFCKGDWIGSYVFHRFLLLRFAVMVWRVLGEASLYKWRACHCHHVLCHDRRNVSNPFKYHIPSTGLSFFYL